LTLCNNIFLKCKRGPELLKITERIDEVSNYFNTYYHNSGGKGSADGNDSFYKEIIERVSVIYEGIHKVYRVYVNDKEALSFWSDERLL
jgi:hypothetical protein